MRLFKFAALTLMLALALPAIAGAATFKAQRGLNMDIWTTWPGEDRWADPAQLLPFPEWRRHVDADQLAEIAAAGFDFLRIPVDPAPFLSARTGVSREDLVEEVLLGVAEVEAAGLKAIVDLHLFPRHDNPGIGMAGVLGNESTFEAYLDLIRMMARRLAREDPQRVALELMNEPEGSCDAFDAGSWPDRLQRLYAAARASATRLTLILSGACGGSAEGLVALDPRHVPDDNVIWTFHSYQPFMMTHQGAMWAGDLVRYVTGLSYPYHAMEPAARAAALDAIRARIRAEAPWTRRNGMIAYVEEQLAEIDGAEKLAVSMEAPFRLVADWAERHRIPPENILLGEFGMIRQEYQNPDIVPAASRAAYVADMIAIAERFGFAWAIWGFGGAFGVVEEFDNRPAEPDVLDAVRALAPLQN